jgi:hypothetical protein
MMVGWKGIPYELTIDIISGYDLAKALLLAVIVSSTDFEITLLPKSPTALARLKTKSIAIIDY